MTVSLIVGIAILVSVLIYMVYLRRKTHRRLDDLSVTGERNSPKG